jgi:hypothetical protein
MNQDAEENFLSASLIGPCAKRGPELAFVLGERAFDVNSLGVDVARESAFERSTIATLGPSAVFAHVHGSHQGSNAQKLSAEFVMALTVIGGVGQDLIKRDPKGAFHQGRGEIGRVVAGALAHLSRQPQVAAGMTEHRQLGESMGPKASGVGPLAAVVETHVPSFVSGGIDGPFGFFLDQAAAVGEVGDRVEQSIETPFLRRRWWAFCSAVQ